MVETNKHEREAWNLFLRACASIPTGAKVELLRGDRVVAWLGSACTQVSAVTQSTGAKPVAVVA